MISEMKPTSTYSNPFSIPASITPYNTNIRPPLTPALYDALDCFLSVFCENPHTLDLANPTEGYDDALMSRFMGCCTHHVSMIGITRNVHERRYRKLTQFKIDVYRLLNNTIMFQRALEVDPHFAAVTNHLRDFFNYALSEYVLPSCRPTPPEVGEGEEGERNGKTSVWREYRAGNMEFDRRESYRMSR